jgi:geranylgeranylglycerol-phosphate geranylgeranyltransferase
MSTLSTYISGFLILARIITSSLLALAVILPSLRKGNYLGASILFALPFFLAAIGGFALNDFFDSAKDAVNKPYRAIPSGKLHPIIVLSTGIISLIVSLILAVLVSRNNKELFLYCLTISGAAFYNVFVKYLSLSKTFLTSILSAVPMLYSVRFFSYPTSYLLLPIATSSFVLGREWLMDIRDMRGDLAGRIVTVPMLVGPATTEKLGFMLQLLSIALLIPIAVNNSSPSSFVLILLMLLSVILSMQLWHWRSGAFQHRVVQGFWLPMLLGELMLLQSS